MPATRTTSAFDNGVKIGEDIYTVSEEYRYNGERRYRPRTRARYWASCACGWNAHGTTLPPVRELAKAHTCLSEGQDDHAR
jgi:hypothetical protein